MFETLKKFKQGTKNVCQDLSKVFVQGFDSRIGLSIVSAKIKEDHSKVPIRSGGPAMCCVHAIELKEIS